MERLQLADEPRRRLYRDRTDAGARLAARLQRYAGQDVLVLGIPRGGVPVAAEVARGLDAELDVVVARKLGAPISPELAIGAVTANGGRFLNDGLIRDLGVPASYLERVTAEQRADAQQREARFRGDHPAPRVRDRVVLVVDDGLATGATMRAAVRSVRQQQPAWLVVAVPVGSPEACAALRAEADELVCLHAPAAFWAVGFYYDHFAPTEDAEVQRLLQEAYACREAAPPQPSPAPTPASAPQAVGASRPQRERAG
jgi:putative phosphoribosyl transferase